MSDPEQGTGGEGPAEANSTLARNIQGILADRQERERAASLESRVAGAISKFAGSMMFVYIHLVLFGGWILINIGLLPILPPWDPSLVVLAMAASVEAIFLSTFVLINQNRMAAQDDLRADLDLQISLLNEHETTRLLMLVDGIAEKLGVRTEPDPEIEDLKREVDPAEVMHQLANAETKATEGPKPD